MDPARWQRIEEIYHLACAHSMSDREALLDRACGADVELRQEVQSLLDQSAPTQALLAIQNAVPPAAFGADVPPDRSGQRLGVFVLESRLGSGGMGEVYRARDTRLQRNVAIKVLRAAAAGAEELKRRLLREARAAAALDHPNICPIYEVGDADGLSFIVMPCFEGETLAARIARCGASRPISDDEAGCIAIVLQIAAALAEAHRHGIVHRDIKPANVMLTSHELAKVLDFGLASAASQPARDTTVLDSTALPGVVAGTVPYMSPEQVRGEPVDARTDVFSLGVVAYELLTGEPPFTRPAMADTISAILTLEPDGLRDQHRISSDMRRILRKCLEKQRADRYPTMDELMAELSSVQDRRLGLPALVVAGARVPAPPIIAAAGDATEFVGRDTELELLAGAWRDAKAGQRRVVLLGGDPGIGKTRMATEFARRCAADGATVLAGRADQDALIPYQPFVEALTWYVRECPERDLVAQLDAIGSGGELAWMVPELRRRIRDLPVPDAVNPESQRYRLFEAVSDLLVRASDSHPVLLLIDDLHWADTATFRLVRHVLRRPDRSALCMVLAFRESDVADNTALSELLVELRRDHAATRLSLRGLAEPAVAQLVRALGGSDAEALFGRMVAESTGGNPFFVGEVVRHLVGSGALSVVHGIRNLSDVGVPEGIKDVIRRRLSRLSDDCRKLLTLGAVVGRDFDLAILAAIEGSEEDELIDSIDEAIRAHSITPVPGAGERFMFAHALIRETLYDELTGPRRTRLHRRVGEALERLTERSPTPPLADLAHHFAQAAPAAGPEKAVRYAIRAGDAAVDSLVFEEAIRFYGMAMQALESQSPGDETNAQKAAVYGQRALAYRALGQWAAQKQEVERALACIDPRQLERRAELTLMLADAGFYLLDLGETKRAAAAALALADEVGRRDIAADATGWLARCQQAAGDLNGAIELDRRAVVPGSGPGRVTRMHGGHTLYLAGRLTEFADEGLRHVELARASHDTHQVMFAMPHLGLGFGAVGRYAEALQAFDDARAFGRRYGVVPPLARSISMSAGLRLMLFDYPTAKELASEARELAGSVTFNPPIVSAGIDLLLIAARTSNFDGVEPLLRDTTARFEAMPGWHEWLWRLRLKQARAELALARGALDTSVSEATEALDQSRSRRPKYQVLALMTRGRARVGLGHMELAIGDAQSAVALARSIGDPALLLQALALLVTTDGNDALLAEAQRLVGQITSALPDETLRRRFTEAEPVRFLLST